MVLLYRPHPFPLLFPLPLPLPSGNQLGHIIQLKSIPHLL